MLCRALKTLKETTEVTPDQTFMAEEKTYFFIFSSSIVILSGIMCLFLEENWTRSFPFLIKIPIYSLVGMSLNYLVNFGIVDFLNLVLSCFQSKNSLNIVETKDQIITLLVTSFSAGSFYGIIFGLMDIEDDSFYRIKNDFFYEERLCIPIGIASGIIAGLFNEILRDNVKLKIMKLIL